MKHRTFLKLGHMLAFLVITLNVSSCSKRDIDAPVGPDLKKAATALDVESEFDEFKPLLEGVARYIAEKQSTISRQVMREKKNKTFVLSELFPEKSGMVSQVGSDGTPYEIGIEFCARSKVNDLPARVALDPDRFYPNENSFTAFVLDSGSGKIISETISKSVKELDFPLVFITLEDRTEIPFADIGKGERKVQFMKSAGEAQLTTTMYLTIGYIDLHTEHDPMSNEEFEIYFREGSGSAHPVYSTTSHKFNGISRNDAAGNYKYYSDINDQSQYILDNIALLTLSSTPMAIAMVEEDGDAGQYNSTCGCEIDKITYAQEYRHDTGQVYNNVDRYHNVYENDFIDGDDVWTSGMFSNFTEANAPPSPFRFTQLNDFDVDLWKDDGIPDPPPPPSTAPNLTGSTSGGHPFLTWSGVSGATGYKIHRSFNGGAYSEIGNTSNLYFIDYTRDVGTSGDYDYTLYKVKGYNAGGDGPFSNQVFYYTVPH